MADEINLNSTPAASPATVEVAPSSVETPVVAPAETPAIETPAVTPEAPTETPAAETPAAEPTPTPEVAKPETLLAGDKKPSEAAEKPSEEKPAEITAEEPVKVELPTFEAFKLPEGVQLEEKGLSEFTNELAEFESTTKADHAAIHALGQKMVDKYVAEQQRQWESLNNAWTKTKNDWKDSFLKDPEFANRTDTVVNSAIDAIGVYGGDAKQQDEFRSLMESTGVGNHPAMIRLLSNIMLAKVEPKQLAAPQIAATAKQSKVSKMYGNKTA